MAGHHTGQRLTLNRTLTLTLTRTLTLTLTLTPIEDGMLARVGVKIRVRIGVGVRDRSGVRVKAHLLTPVGHRGYGLLHRKLPYSRRQHHCSTPRSHGILSGRVITPASEEDNAGWGHGYGHGEGQTNGLHWGPY